MVIPEIFQTKHAKNWSDLYPMELNNVERLKSVLLPNLNSAQVGGYQTNKKCLAKICSADHILQRGPSLQKLIAKTI